MARIRRLGGRAAAAAIAALPIVAAPPARAADSAVVFVYHRFGEAAYPSTSIRLGQFEAEIAELKSGRYTVLPLPEIVAALRAGRSLPPFTVGLSVDDAYASAFTEAWPRLRAAHLPLTVFVATDPVDRHYADMMSWDQIRTLARAGVTIGGHTASHLHMADADAARDAAELDRSNARFRAELGAVPTLFAYPYGEYARALDPAVAKAGYVAAFGQQSGVLYPGSDFRYLPRFALNQHYGTIDRFRLAARALPLPATDITPADPLLKPGAANPPLFGFTVDPSLAGGLRRLACYSSREGRVRTERIGGRRVEVRMTRPFPPGRSRINCTLPGPDGRWRWLGIQFYVPGGRQ